MEAMRRKRKFVILARRAWRGEMRHWNWSFVEVLPEDHDMEPPNWRVRVLVTSFLREESLGDMWYSRDSWMAMGSGPEEWKEEEEES